MWLVCGDSDAWKPDRNVYPICMSIYLYSLIQTFATIRASISVLFYLALADDDAVHDAENKVMIKASKRWTMQSMVSIQWYFTTYSKYYALYMPVRILPKSKNRSPSHLWSTRETENLTFAQVTLFTSKLESGPTLTDYFRVTSPPFLDPNRTWFIPFGLVKLNQLASEWKIINNPWSLILHGS